MTSTVDKIFAEHFSIINVPKFCWWPTTLLTMEIAHMRTVYGRKRRSDGKWEYYNYPNVGYPLRHRFD